MVLSQHIPENNFFCESVEDQFYDGESQMGQFWEERSKPLEETENPFLQGDPQSGGDWT
jgi:hypothetical protein